ncbi:hypothetical protein [Urechidicola croceus]|uniref:hypothetical protein n=1 Tax=Urechidicola croceus TaxID=1850246 RepID=UPI000A4725F4|nr:hypothetical protein [Urechidicola croceus]
MTLLLLSCCIICVYSQNEDSTLKNGIDKPSTLTTHHFGIFSSRINQNFKIKPPEKSTLNFSIESGNTMHPFVEAYLPKDQAVRASFNNINWFDRQFTFIDQETTPAEYMNIVVDAVIKGFRVDFNTKISDEHEVGISVRSYLINNGKYPLSFFTSDESIEWFHSNIAGGEDPFGRRYYGLNQVDFKYTDRNGKVLELNNGDFLMGGIELNYYYYPKFLINQKENFFVNFGSHIGLNTSKYNSSTDIGISANAIKNIKLQSNNEFNIGLGISILKKNLIDFKDNIDLGNNSLLGTFEGEFEFTKYTKLKNYHSFGINYQIQTRYNKNEESDYYKLVGLWSEINAGWHNGFSTLYSSLSNWTFLYTYGKPKYKLTLYLKEDFFVNNAPDVQTGISLKIPISKN